MKPGRQWLAFDADFFDNSFAIALMGRFGHAGVSLFVAFLCACKTSHTPGRFGYRNEEQALELLGLDGVPLLDIAGEPFTLEQFWEFTGRHKQTSRSRYGHTLHVTCTGWEQWQKSIFTQLARERKRRSRANSGHKNVTAEIEKEKEKDIRGTFVPNGQVKNTPQPTHVDYPQWNPQPDVEADPIALKAGLAQLRAQLEGETDKPAG